MAFVGSTQWSTVSVNPLANRHDVGGYPATSATCLLFRGARRRKIRILKNADAREDEVGFAQPRNDADSRNTAAC